MTALDDAIARYLSHPAGSMADPLTDELCDQACYAVAPPPAEAATEFGVEPLLSDGTRPSDECPWYWRLMVVAVVVSIFISSAYPEGFIQWPFR